jgi:ribosomal protein S27AE
MKTFTGPNRSLGKKNDDRDWQSEERSFSLASAQNLMSYRKQDALVSWEMWPFNKNQIGNLQKYGSPAFLGPRDAKEDTYGFCGDLYCPNCGTKSDFMLIEFQKPSADLMAAWMDIDINEIDEDLLRCPKCGQSDLEPS